MANPTQNPVTRAASLVLVALVIAALYFGREFLIPLALAVLISFLLAPLIRRFEHWHLGRIASVLLAAALAFSAIGVTGYLIVGQVIDLASELEGYKTNLTAKIEALKSKPDSAMSRASRTFQELGKDLAKIDPTAPAPITPEAPEPKAGEMGPIPPPPSSVEPAVPVSVVKSPGNAASVLHDLIEPVLAPLGTVAIVIVFVIFISLEREDLRDRVIHLIGRGRLRVTTQAIDEAAKRVSRYLVAQLIVNVTYGIPIGVGLYFIGIPNAFLWGFLAILLRFIPYIGPWIAAIFPVALSLAVSPTWAMPLMTLGLFVVVELISNNAVEPWLYGSSTGLSPMAIIVAAAFWTWLWGAPGLILATPLTVCIAVLGKYVPNLSYLDVLLGDKPPIAHADRFYQRLLALDEDEAIDLAEARVVEDDLATTYDEMVLPAVAQSESDFRDGELTEAGRQELGAVLREVLEELRDAPLIPIEEASVVCVPARGEADELAALMLAHMLAEAGVKTTVLSSKLMTGEMVERVVAASPALICISAFPPRSTSSAAHLCARIREGMEKGVIAVGCWGHGAVEDPRRIERLQRSHADHVFTTLKQAVAEIRAHPGFETVAEIVEEKAA